MAEHVDMERVGTVLKPFRPLRANLIPALQAIQEEFGYVPPEAVGTLAKHLKVFPSEVSGVITFYSQFVTTPRGKNVIRVCRGTACHIRGGKTVYQTVSKFTALEEGQTSEDMRFTLETVACLGACALSPVMVINKNYYGKLNPGRIEGVLKNLP